MVVLLYPCKRLDLFVVLMPKQNGGPVSIRRKNSLIDTQIIENKELFFFLRTSHLRIYLLLCSKLPKHERRVTEKSTLLTSPLTGSGLLTTAASATALCSIKALSTSNGPIRYLSSNHASIPICTGNNDLCSFI